MSERVIDKMIADVRNKSVEEKRQRQDELDRRRANALSRIGQAAIDHDLGIAQSIEAEQMLIARLEQAAKARISEAEAMADAAESMGDFESRLYWWEIVSKEGLSLWKNYTLYGKRLRIRIVVVSGGREVVEQFEGTEDLLDINVRRTTTGGYVAELYVENFGRTGVASVGISEGSGASAEEAVVGAYLAFYNGVKEGTVLAIEEVPEELRKQAREDGALTRKE